MLNKQKQLNLIGLAQRANLLVSGEEIVLTKIKNNQAKLVIVATDCSENTKKKLLDKSQYYGVDCVIAFETMEISHALGKKRSVIAFIDNGFARSFQKLAQ